MHVSDRLNIDFGLINDRRTRNINGVITLLHVWAPCGDQMPVHLISHHLLKQIAHMMRDPCAPHFVEKA